MQFVGLGQSGVTHDAFAYDASGAVHNGSAFGAWSDAAYASYRIAAAEQGTSGRYLATLPAGTARWELRVQAGTLAGSVVVWEEAVAATGGGGGGDITVEGNSYSATDRD